MKFIKPFFWGIIGALGALVLEIFFLGFFPDQEKIFEAITLVLIASILIEEIFKFLMIYQLFRETEKVRDIFSGSLLVGLGFSAVEIFLLSLKQEFSGNYFYAGSAGIIIVHLATSAILGFLIARNNLKKAVAGIGFIFLAAILHLTYNSLIIYNIPGIFVLFYLFFLALMLLFIIPKKSTGQFAK